MALCKSCANIKFDNLSFYMYQEAGLDTTCPLCKFMLRLMGFDDTSVGERAYVWTTSARLVLHQLERPKNRVDILITEEVDGKVKVDVKDVKGQLRLCSTYGVERSLLHDVKAEEDELPGRRISAHADYDDCFDIAKGWMERCTRTHGPACALQTSAPFPTRLVYIPRESNRPLRVQNTNGMTGQYATLSYVWGHGDIYNTTRTNLASRMEGFRRRELPKTLRDAVKITRHLGFEWLWIDALCILQDDLDDWTHESALMASVYGNAAFTISADAARDTNDGILQPRNLQQSPSFGPHDDFCFQELELPWEGLITQHVYRRGWAFQERILSVRVLHFLKDQIAWECNTTIYREGFHGRETNTDQHFGKSGYTKQFHRQKPYKIEDEREIISQISAWNSMVQELVFRNFTVLTDRFAAISGIATALELPELGTYFAGMFRRTLLFNLDTYSVGVWERNPFLTMGWYMRFSQERSPNYRSPSWSWEWTEGQIIMPPGPCNLAITAEDEATWSDWDAKWSPRLVDRNVILQSAQSKGRVLEGTSMTISGHCRYLYMEEDPDTEYDEWGFYIDDEHNEPGMKVHPDRRPTDRGYKLEFCEGDEVSEDQNVACRYLCVQILRDRKPQDANPKVFALILEQDGNEGDVYKRYGIAAFDFDESDGKKWERKTLTLI